jgi:hypothetical protein
MPRSCASSIAGNFGDSQSHRSSCRAMLAPSTIAFILPNATSRGRYFIPQSVHTIRFRMPEQTRMKARGKILDSDAVFGMKESLVAQFERHPPGIGPNGERMDTPCYTVAYDFRLRPEPRLGGSTTPPIFPTIT